jgi:hypothetical protein
MVGKGDVGKCGHQVAWMEGRLEIGVGHRLGRALGMGNFVCCFFLALLSVVAIFILFQCSLACQHSNRFVLTKSERTNL